MSNTFSGILKQYDLLQHPFYLAWNEGTLTHKQLALYASEYGSFIKLIGRGWQEIGENEIANEETGHYELWKNFAASIGSNSIGASLPAVKQLVDITETSYKTYAGTLGALYAFEAQQPATASSKLIGLREHYGHWNADEAYFITHRDDLHEPAMLEEKINMLTEREKAISESACEHICNALWEALSGIMTVNMN